MVRLFRSVEKLLILSFLVVVCILFVGRWQDANGAPPPETQEAWDWEANYKPHRAEGKRLFDLGKYEEAIKAYAKAISGSRFLYVQAGQTRNTALAQLLIAKRDNDKAKAREALQTYRKATLLLVKADAWCSDGCKHPTDCTKARELTNLHIAQGRAATERWLKTGK